VDSSSASRAIEYDPKRLETRVRYNISFLKAFKRVSDARIAEHGGFTSRQVVNNRINGDTNLSMEDLARIASALTVEPHVLFMPLDEMSRWIEDHPDYVAPRYTKQPPGRQGGK
jgi:transcriptional regulator with XRE-family HTH domain